VREHAWGKVEVGKDKGKTARMGGEGRRGRVEGGWSKVGRAAMGGEREHKHEGTSKEAGWVGVEGKRAHMGWDEG
jgi:hypothetical protein